MNKKHWIDFLISAVVAVAVREVLTNVLAEGFNENAFMNLATRGVVFIAVSMGLTYLRTWWAGDIASPRTQESHPRVGEEGSTPRDEFRARSSGRFFSHVPKVQALWSRGQELAERRATVGEFLDLQRETKDVMKDTSLPIAGWFSLFRLTNGIDETLDKWMNEVPSLRDSPEAQDVRREYARYKETFSPELLRVMERLCESKSAEDTKAFGDLLFPKEHSARLMMILDHATDSARATHGELFTDWVRLKGYSPSEVAEYVDIDAIQRLSIATDDPAPQGKIEGITRDRSIRSSLDNSSRLHRPAYMASGYACGRAALSKSRLPTFIGRQG
jgi:hypothetical protein